MRLNRRRFALGASVSIFGLSLVPHLANAAGADGAVALKPATDTVHPFPLGAVRLNAGPFWDAQMWNRNFMLRLDPERLLHTFRLNASLPTAAKPLGGWEAPGCELRGHFVGHYLSACALASAAQGDAELKRRGDLVVTGLSACQAALNQKGYLSAFPQELFVRLDARKPVWAPFYTYHKIMAGLLDMHVHAGNAEALDVVIGMANWVDQWTAARSRVHMQDILNEEFGGMTDVLCKLAQVTGDAKWIAVGDRFCKDSFFVPLAARFDALRGLHMNTHVPQVIGAAQRYQVTGDLRYRHIAAFFWETVTTARTYATGGASVNEHWLSEPYQLGDEWKRGVNHQECCCCYNMLKLTRQLFAQQPDARFMDYYERNLVNHRLGTIEPQTGRTMYFLSLASGAWRTVATDEDSFWCCTGSGIEEFSKLSDSIYFHDDAGIYVNLFIASTLTWAERGVRLVQTTDFPQGGKTTLTLAETSASAWPLHIRIPGWTTTRARIRLNGKALEITADPGSYLQIERRWKAGDRVELDLPMPLHSEGFTDRPELQALLVGPVVLAAQLPRGDIPEALLHQQGPDLAKLPFAMPALNANGVALEELVTTTNSPERHYTLKTSGGELTLKPFYQSNDRYAVYLDTAT